MKIKSILSIAAFSTAFIASTFLAGLFFDKSDNQSNLVSFNEAAQSNDYNHSCSSKLKKRIWLFLEEDYRNGLTVEKELRSQTAEMVVNEQKATANLALKMNQMNDSDLPSDFRVAWVNHIAAWDEQASFLSRAVKDGNRQNIYGDLLNDYMENREEIDRTYSILLETANEYGVSFPK